MKLLIASDIHGSAHYCAQLMARIEAENPDQVLLLGDLLYHGPRNALPEEYDCPKAYDMLNGIKERIVAVRGNCDSEVDQMVLEFPIMADYALLEAGRDGAAQRTHPCPRLYAPRQLCLYEPRLRLHSQGGQPAQLYGLGKRGIPVERFGGHGISGVSRAAGRPLAALGRPREREEALC